MGALPLHAQTDGRNGLASRGADGDVEQIRHAAPELHDKTVHSLCHPHFHVPVAVNPSQIRGNLAEKVMGRIALVAARHHHDPASIASHAAEIPGQKAVSVMIPHVGSHPQADHHRPFKSFGKGIRIPNGQHNIRLCIGRNICRQEIILPQIRLALFQLDHQNIRLGSRSQIGGPIVQAAARRHSRQSAAMPQFIPAGNDAEGIFRLQRLIDLLPGIDGAEVQFLGRFSVLNGLIPDGQNSGTAVLISESRRCIVHTRVNTAENAALSGQIEGISLHG